jgi:hypothetical protein
MIDDCPLKSRLTVNLQPPIFTDFCIIVMESGLLMFKILRTGV